MNPDKNIHYSNIVSLCFGTPSPMPYLDIDGFIHTFIAWETLEVDQANINYFK
jgi:hypothetical protein